MGVFVFLQKGSIMVRVSGPLVNVTTSASSVRDVQVHTKKVRAWGDGLMTPDPSQAKLSNGVVEFEAAPGPVVMVLFLVEAGAETVSLVVGEGATQSLADAYRDGQMADDRDAGELAGILEQIRASVGASAEARAGAEAAAVDAAGSAASAGRDADRAEEAEAGAVEAEEGAEAGQELSEDAAAVAVAAAIGAGESTWLRPPLDMDTDMNAVKTPGVHPMSNYGTASSAVNRPTEQGSVNPGFVEVHPSRHLEGLLRQVWVTTPEAASSAAPFRAERWFHGAVDGVEIWSPWKSDANAGYVKAPLEMGADVRTITETGAYPIASYSHAASLVNRPTQWGANNMGMLWVANSTHRNNTRKLTWETYPEAGSASPAMKLVSYYEGDTAGTWTPWEEEKSGAGDVGPLEITVGGLTDKVNELQVKVDAYTAPTITKLADTHVGSGMKVVPLSITLGTGNGVTEASSGSWRMPVMWNAPILRWRLCVTTRNPRFGNTPGNDVVLRRVTWGQHSGNAAFSSAPATIAENFTVPGNGDIVRMPWQNTPITEGQEHLLAFDWASSGLVQANMGSGWATTNESDSVSPGTTTRRIASPLDWWVEAETYATTPTVAVLGDSISSGHSADVVGPVGSWLSIYMRQKRGLPVHYSAGGEKARDWWQYNDYKRTRWADLSKADACIFALGYNDAADGADPQTFEQHVANVMECLPIVREYISQNIYGVTITPSVNLDAGREAERVKMNNWMRSEKSIFRDVFDFEQAVIDTDTGGLRPEYSAADKTHLSSTGYGQLAASIARPVTTPPVMYQTV